MVLRPALVALLLAVPSMALAAGSDDDTPPKPTKTTTECAEGTVWDEAKKDCVNPQESHLRSFQIWGQRVGLLALMCILKF